MAFSPLRSTQPTGAPAVILADRDQRRSDGGHPAGVTLGTASAAQGGGQEAELGGGLPLPEPAVVAALGEVDLGALGRPGDAVADRAAAALGGEAAEPPRAGR